MKKGTIERLSVEMTDPLKIEIPDLEFRMLSLFTGANGAGKSFIFKILWFLTYSAGMHITTKVPDTPDGKKMFLNVLATLLKGTFADIRNITGKAKCTFDEIGTIEVTIDKGEVIDYVQTDLDKYDNIVCITYMTTEMRTFEAIKNYITIKHLITGNILGDFTPEQLEKMMNSYKLYNIQAIEILIRKCPFKFEDPSLKSLKDLGFEDAQPETFDLDAHRGEFYLTFPDGTRKDMTAYGKGHQSIVNMIVMSNL